VVAGTGLVLAVPGATSWGHVTGLPLEDSRTAAAAWMTDHVPPGSTVLLERYGPEPRESWNLLYLPFHGITPHVYDPAYSPALYTTFDFIILSSGVHGRYLAHPREYPAQVEFYLAVAEGFREAARFSTPDYAGPSIIVYRRPENLGWGRLDGIPASFFNGLAGNRPLAEFFAQLGGVLGRQGRSDLADRILNAALEMDPQNGRIWGSRGAVQLGDGRFEDALSSLRKARDLEPDRADIAYNLASLYRQMGELTQAAAAYRAALAADPFLEDGYIGLARVLVEEVHYAEARVVLRAFLSRFPRSPRRESAETALKELAAMGPGKP
jgi:tetratricopeptide (TPR) repeat protein